MPSVFTKCLHGRPPVGRDHVPHGLAVFRHERIEIDQVSEALRRAIGNACDHHPARAVPHQDDAAEVLIRQDIHDVLHMDIESDVGLAR